MRSRRCSFAAWWPLVVPGGLYVVEDTHTSYDTEHYGYVPNVVYSCGGMIHEGRLWLPYGIGDSRIGVAWAQVDELLAAMRS